MASANAIYVQLQKMTDAANQREMDFNKQEASTARDWQTEMSNTSHQRETKDLIAAGLNPILSANSGAQSYTTSSASTNQDSGANALASAYGATTSAAATRAAAAQSAAATKFASMQSLKAAQAQASAMKYSADRSYNAQIDSAKWSYKTAMEKPQSIQNMPDKWLDKGIKFVKSQIDKVKGASALRSRITSNRVIGISGVAKMNSSFKSAVDQQLRSLGFAVNDSNRANLYNFYSNYSNSSATKYWKKLSKR